jgi:hypothetical protein
MIMLMRMIIMIVIIVIEIDFNNYKKNRTENERVVHLWEMKSANEYTTTTK